MVFLSVSRRVAVVVCVALVAAGCSGDPAGESGTSTIAGPATTVPASTTTVPPTVTVPLDASLGDQIDALTAMTEDLRGLEFTALPRVVVLDETALAARAAELAGSSVSAAAAAFYRFVGLLPDDVDLEAALAEVAASPPPVLADIAAGELLVSDRERLSPLEMMTAVYELDRMLTGQHFGHGVAWDALVAAGDVDGATALRALVGGDAAYIQLLFYETRLSEEERATAALEAAARNGGPVSELPEFVQADLRFPGEHGFDFVSRLVAAGGLAALDAAHRNPPGTTEQILDPDRYALGEQGRQVDLPALSAAGYVEGETGTLGRWGLEVLFAGQFPDGEVIQAGDGWGGDRYRLLTDGEDVGFVLRYQGDTERDAREVTQLFIDHAREILGAGEGVVDADGLLFDAGGPYVFLDRAVDRLLVVMASDPAVGRVLRDQAGMP